MFKRSKLQKLGPLEYIDVPCDVESATLVIFHGYGADAYDLASLSEEMELSQPVRWVFPNGPLSVSVGPGHQGRAWMQIRQEILQAMMSGEAPDFTDRRPEDMDSALSKATEFIRKLDVPNKKLILGGFSQGSMMAVEIAAQLPEAPLGLVILSGNAIDLQGLKQRAQHFKGMPFFLSHGTHDMILPIVGARKLSAALSQLGCKGNVYEFPGGHEIPIPIIIELQKFINRLLTSS